MKTISLKIPDDVFEKVEKYRKSEKKNRTSYVMEAVVEYNKKVERNELDKRLLEESKRTLEERKKFKNETNEWDVTLMDGLEDEDWEGDQ